MPARRPWRYAVGGAVVAAVVVVAGVAVAGDRLGLTGSTSVGPSVSPGDGATSSPAAPAAPAGSPGPSGSSSAGAAGPGDQLVVAAYYLGDGGAGTRLFREFRRVEAPDPLAAGLAALQAAPHDPDYRTAFPRGSFASASFDGTGADGEVGIELADAGLAARPRGLSAADARLAVQQVVYTMQAAVQARASVGFYLEGRRVTRVYGVRTPPGLRNAPALDVLSQMSISSPEEGAVVSGSFTASGVGSSFEANIPWEVRRGDATVRHGFTTADGWMDRLYPWRTGPINVSRLAPGTYTFVAMTDDPSAGEAGAEGPGPAIDTRTIVVR